MIICINKFNYFCILLLLPLGFMSADGFHAELWSVGLVYGGKITVVLK